MDTKRSLARGALIALLVSTLSASAAWAESTHPFTVHDLVKCQRISGPQVAPRGNAVVFVLRTTDMDANRGRTDIWRVNLDGSGLRRLTTHPAADFEPRWTPDGRSIYFLSTRSGSPQVWRLALDGGEAEQVTRLPLDVGTFHISPDGSRLALALDVFPEKTVEETARELERREADPTTGLAYERLFARHWDTWKDGRRSHVFVMPIDGNTPVDIMRGMDADCPTRPFGGPEDFTFTPDGREIVFAARRAENEAWSTNFDLFVAPSEGNGTPRCLTTENPAWDAQPTFSPDGRTLAYLAMRRAGYEADRFQITLRSWPDGATRELATNWDRSVRGLAWSADGRQLLVTASDLGNTALFTVDVSTGAAQRVIDSGTVRAVQAVGDGRILFGLDGLESPVELHTCDANGENRRQLTRINEPILKSAQLGEAEQFTFTGWNDETVHGYVLRPADFETGRQYPIAFLIHGGPQGSFGDHWHYRWNPQTYAGHGYAAVFIDFHGSTGYGQAFTDSIRGDWGGKPLVDLQKGLDAALLKYPWLDGERVAALGASYGGYMVNWIAGNWPERFRCLVSHDGVFNTRQMFFATEELWFPEWENNGTPWASPETYRRNNPVEHIDKWKTPMLIIHGARDYRVVDTDGIAAFTACQRRGIPSKLLYYPDENHWVLKPHNSIQWHDTVLEWLDRWCKP